jgi:hypothetical protein
MLKQVICWMMGLALGGSAAALIFVLVVRISFYAFTGYGIDPTLCELARYALKRPSAAYVLRRCPVQIGIPLADRTTDRIINEMSAGGSLTILLIASSLAFALSLPLGVKVTQNAS